MCARAQEATPTFYCGTRLHFTIDTKKSQKNKSAKLKNIYRYVTVKLLVLMTVPYNYACIIIMNELMYCNLYIIIVDLNHFASNIILILNDYC